MVYQSRGQAARFGLSAGGIAAIPYLDARSAGAKPLDACAEHVACPMFGAYFLRIIRRHARVHNHDLVIGGEPTCRGGEGRQELV
jgi:hypothetical protein